MKKQNIIIKTILYILTCIDYHQSIYEMSCFIITLKSLLDTTGRGSYIHTTQGNGISINRSLKNMNSLLHYWNNTFQHIARTKEMKKTIKYSKPYLKCSFPHIISLIIEFFRFSWNITLPLYIYISSTFKIITIFHYLFSVFCTQLRYNF